MENKTTAQLKLMQLADSALPIGTLAHSYGLETLVEEGSLRVAGLQPFLRDYLAETGKVEAVYCRKAHRLAAFDDATFPAEWLDLNSQIDALKLARESREASAALGRRFLQLVTKLDTVPLADMALQTAKSHSVGTHYCTAFGLACGLLDIESEMTVAAFLQQSITSLVSACQRLMPLGQTEASRLIWQLKPDILAAVEQSEAIDLPPMFTQSIEIASMRHPDLATRLFIS